MNHQTQVKAFILMAEVELTLLAVDNDQSKVVKIIRSRSVTAGVHRGDESSCADKIILSWHNKHGRVSLLWVGSAILRFNKLQNHHWTG